MIDFPTGIVLEMYRAREVLETPLHALTITSLGATLMADITEAQSCPIVTREEDGDDRKRQRRREISAKFRETHREQLRQDGARYRAENREKLRKIALESNARRKESGYNKAYYQNVKAQKLDYAAKYRADNIDVISAKRSARWKAFKANRDAEAARFAIENAELIANQRAEHKAALHARKLAAKKAYYAKNKERIRANQATYNRTEKALEASRERTRKRNLSVKGALNRRMTNAIYKCLKGTKGGKPWEALVGYTSEQLKNHIERQFVRGMSWSNMGRWHVDHIIPLSSFSFISYDDPEFKAAWALTNLRPLWAEDNIAKSNKRTVLL